MKAWMLPALLAVLAADHALANDVHKCLIGNRTVYSEQPCPKGARDATPDFSGTTLSLYTTPKQVERPPPGQARRKALVETHATHGNAVR
jgi:hypothetical protein